MKIGDRVQLSDGRTGEVAHDAKPEDRMVLVLLDEQFRTRIVTDPRYPSRTAGMPWPTGFDPDTMCFSWFRREDILP